MINKELLKRKIPEFFVKDKRQITSVIEWEAFRAELKELFLREEYGCLPPKIIPSIKVEPQFIDFAGKAIWESIYFTFQNKDKAHTVRAELILPKNKSNIPVFLYISFSPDIPNKYLPVEEIIDNGFGIFTFYYESVTPDNNDFSGLCNVFDSIECGKISLWSYMASACMDYLCSRSDIDTKNVAIIGHSRLGKTALLTSALDDRFILTCANESGCCGAALSRGKEQENESLDDIIRVFPWWFCKSFFKYRSTPETLPFDQHMLLALIAPRYLMVGGAKEDAWADNKGQLLSCYLASYAWKFYKKEGLLMTQSTFPKANEALTQGEIGFYLREGTHFLSRSDWSIYMTKFKEIIKRKI